MDTNGGSMDGHPAINPGMRSLPTTTQRHSISRLNGVRRPPRPLRPAVVAAIVVGVVGGIVVRVIHGGRRVVALRAVSAARQSTQATNETTTKRWLCSMYPPSSAHHRPSVNPTQPTLAQSVGHNVVVIRNTAGCTTAHPPSPSIHQSDTLGLAADNRSDTQPV